MNIEIKRARLEDKEFILFANREINIASGLNKSILEKNINDDIFNKELCKCLVAKVDGVDVGMCLYSDIYWANIGKGVYLSQLYVQDNYRGKKIGNKMLEKIIEDEEYKFITCLVGEENENMKKIMYKLKANSCNLTTYFIKTDDIP